MSLAKLLKLGERLSLDDSLAVWAEKMGRKLDNVLRAVLASDRWSQGGLAAANAVMNKLLVQA